LEDRDLPAVQVHVRALMDALTEKIGFHASRFHEYDQMQDVGFSIGTGLAGYTVEQIAPMFKDAIDVPNIHLPESFWKVLMKG
jgi:hypothetical protein